MAKKELPEDEYVDLSTSFELDNICKNEFTEVEWNCGIDIASRYAAMYVAFRNCDISEDSCIELVKEIINNK